MEPIVRITEDSEIWFTNGGFEERTIVHGTPTLSEYEEMYDPRKELVNPHMSKHLCIELNGDLYEWVEI